MRVRIPSLSKFYNFVVVFKVWGEAVVACQFHALNVEGSNPSPTTNSLSGGMVDTVDLKFTPLRGLGSTPRMGSRYGGIGRHVGFRPHWL